jgi:Uncharacterized protein conserved in bacteria
MSKYLLFFLLVAFSFPAFSQQKDENIFFNTNNDTLVLYFNAGGNITTKLNAVFYRKAILDKEVFNYNGTVSDYFINNQKAYECNFSSKELNGIVRCFYSNGNLQYIGHFNNYNKDSVWTYYYDNGNIEKVIQFMDSIPIIKELYKRNSKVVFNNGNGRYISKILYSDAPLECTITGKVVNGKMEGAWHWTGTYAQGIEYYSNGKYVRTENYGLNDGFKNPRIISITGFDPHENVNIFDFFTLPQESIQRDMTLKGIPFAFKGNQIATSISFNSSSSNNLPLKYKTSSNLKKEFSWDFSNHLSKVIKSNQINFFWCFIQFEVNKNNQVKNISVYSNNEIIELDIKKYLSNITDFESARINNEDVTCDIYLNLYFENNTLYIPNYHYGNIIFNEFNSN